MKMSEIFGFQNLRTKIKDSIIPIRLAYKFSRFFAALDKENEFFNTTLNNLIQTYGKRDKDGNLVLSDDRTSVLIDDERRAECMEKTKELNDLEITLEYTPSFTFDELEGIGLTMQEVDLLMPYIQE